jgi:protein-tyrosine kinase
LPIDQAICRVEDTRLFVSPFFQHSALTPQKLGSEATDELWEQLRQRFEYVLIDSPPVTTSSDGLAIVRKVDGVIFVVEAKKTRWPVAVAAKEKILSHGATSSGWCSTRGVTTCLNLFTRECEQNQRSTRHGPKVIKP